MLDVSGRYLGSVGIDSHKPHFELSPQMYEVTRTITAQIMMTLRNIRQLRNTQRQAAQLQELALLNQNIQTELEAETILKTGVETLPRILEADHIAVYVMSGESQPPELLFTKVGEALEKHSNRSLKATEQTSLGAVIKGRDMIALSDANLGDTRFTLDAEPRSVLASPLFARGVIVGVIEIATARAYAYEDTDAVVFRQFATQLSIALENAQAYNQSQRVARSKALVNEISSQMQQQQEFEDVLNVTIEQLGRALGARKGRIRLGKADQNK
jgi:GAF domain-containing protein